MQSLNSHEKLLVPLMIDEVVLSDCPNVFRKDLRDFGHSPEELTKNTYFCLILNTKGELIPNGRKYS